MDGDYICHNCQTLYTLEGLKDNEDGICPWCGCPLESLHGETFFNMQALGQEPSNYTFKNMELNLMVDNLRVYPIDDVWHNVELLKNVKERVKERKLFFEALKLLGKKKTGY